MTIMTEKEKEGSIIIAKFVGATFDEERFKMSNGLNYYTFPITPHPLGGGIHFPEIGMQYYKSLDWLIQPIKKFKELKFSSEVNIQIHQRYIKSIQALLTGTYHAGMICTELVLAIKWYNENK